MSSDDKNILPTFTSPNKYINNETEKSVDWQNQDRRRRRFICYAISSAVLAFLATVVLVLSLTVYKVREPALRLNSINFHNLDLSKNLTVAADVSVKNPNSLTFRFRSSTTLLLYRNKEVGLAYGPPGSVGAHRTFRTTVMVTVITDWLLSDSKFVGDAQRGSVGLETRTTVGGRVKILGMFKRHVGVTMNCTVNVSIFSREILDQHCTQHVWL